MTAQWSTDKLQIIGLDQFLYAVFSEIHSLSWYAGAKMGVCVPDKCHQTCVCERAATELIWTTDKYNSVYYLL